MPYVDSHGNIVESKRSKFSFLWQFFSFLVHFFLTLFGPLIGETRQRPSRNRHDWSNSDQWPGNGGPGGPPRGGARRRPIGRPTFLSRMSCPPAGGGG